MYKTLAIQPRPVVGGGVMHHPKPAKRSTFSHKVDQKWGLCRRLEGVKFKKFTFWVQKGLKGQLFLGGGPTLPQILSWLYAWFNPRYPTTWCDNLRKFTWLFPGQQHLSFKFEVLPKLRQPIKNKLLKCKCLLKQTFQKR